MDLHTLVPAEYIDLTCWKAKKSNEKMIAHERPPELLPDRLMVLSHRWVLMAWFDCYQCKLWIQTAWVQIHPSSLLEKAMAPHSSTLAWKILWTGEPGGLPSMGSHRVGRDWSDLAAAAAAEAKRKEKNFLLHSRNSHKISLGHSIRLPDEREFG